MRPGCRTAWPCARCTEAGRDTARSPRTRSPASSPAPAPGLSSPTRSTCHSLRAGFATASYLAGRDLLTIARHGRRADNSTELLGYIRGISRWENNPTDGLDIDPTRAAGRARRGSAATGRAHSRGVLTGPPHVHPLPLEE